MERWGVLFLVLGGALALHAGPRHKAAPRAKRSLIPPPPGVLHDYPLANFPPDWEIVYHHPFSQPMQPKDIFPRTGECLLWATKSDPYSDTYSLAAIGDREKIEEALDMDHMGNLTTVFENGLFWYMGPTNEWLFAGIAELNEIQGTPALGDSTCIADCNSRISWIVNSTFGGYFRSGDQGFSLGVPVPLSNDWRKVVAYGPCEVFAEDPEPARPPRGHGDPHMTNVKGEKFDIFRTGNIVLLQVPQAVREVTSTELQVVANIMPMRNLTCSPIFIGMVEVSGSLLGGATIQIAPDQSKPHRPILVASNTDAERKLFGNVSLSNTRNHNLVVTVSTADATAQITVWQRIKPKYDFHYLDIEATGIEAFGTDIGGMLGYDSHADISKKRPECYNRKEANQQQLISNAHVKPPGKHFNILNERH